MLTLFALCLTTRFPSTLKERLVWMVKNWVYGSMFKQRRFDRTPLQDNTNLWNDIGKHFHYVSEHFKNTNILLAPVVSATMFDRHAQKHVVKNEEVRSIIKKISTEWGISFNEDPNGIANWLSIFGAFIEKAEQLDNRFPNSISSCGFVEFGPGLGGAARLYSRHWGAKGILFDLPEITNLRSVVNEALDQHQQNNMELFDEFTDVDSLLERLQSESNFNFISTYAFTEAPMDVRERFFEVLQKSKTILIVSNSNFENLDNFTYLNNLAKRLSEHSHTFCTLEFLTNAMGYQKRHQLHLFVHNTA